MRDENEQGAHSLKLLRCLCRAEKYLFHIWETGTGTVISPVESTLFMYICILLFRVVLVQSPILLPKVTIFVFCIAQSILTILIISYRVMNVVVSFSPNSFIYTTPFRGTEKLGRWCWWKIVILCIINWLSSYL